MKVKLLCGPIRSGKSDFVVQEYLDAVRRGGMLSALLLLPTANQVELTRRRILLENGREALWRPRILTFPELASQILDAAGISSPQLSTVGERSLMRLVLRQLERELSSFERVLHFPGFVEELCEFVGELKRAAVEPTEFLEKLRAAGLLDGRGQELHRIYETYQESLHRLNVFDVEGRFWTAREILYTRPDAMSWPEHILVDGFENFTTTQLEMLAAFAKRGGELVVTVTCDLDDPRRDFFTTTKRTVDALKERFPEAELITQSGVTISGPAGHLSRFLFHPSPEEAEPGDAISIIEAPGRRREVEALARRIKGMLIDGTSPENIGVLFRSLVDYGEIIGDVFARFGIPTRMGQWMSAERQTACRTVLSLLRIIQRDFLRTDVIQFLNSGYVRFDPFPLDESTGRGPVFTPDDLDDIARRARVTGGKSEWLQRLAAAHNRWKAILDEDETPGEDEPLESRDALERRVQRADLSMQYMGAFIKKLERMPLKGTPAEFVSALAELIDDFRIPMHLADSAASEASSANVRAFRELLFALDDIATTGQLLAEAEIGSSLITLAEFVRDLRTALSHAVFQPEGSRLGRVSVLEAHQARQLTFRHVFIGGLVEKGFPRSRTEEPFYSDRERRRLVRAGLMLEERLPQQRDEAMLFYGAVCASEETLTLSYPITDTEGKEVLTSYYVQEVERCFMPAISRQRVRLSDLIPEFFEAVHPAELLERSLLEQDDRETVVGLPVTNRDAVENAIEGAIVERRRESAEPFDYCDGVLSSLEVKDRLADRFGPSHLFSPNQLNSMGKCPFQFFASRVLGFSAQEDQSEEADNLERGQALHEILNRFFTEAARPERLGTTRLRKENIGPARSLMAEVTSACFRDRLRRGLVGDPTLWEIEQSVLERYLNLFLDYEMERQSEDDARGEVFLPSHFEYAYGKDGEGALVVGEGEEGFLLGGRIDRVDISEADDKRFRVWDYKLSRSRQAKDAFRGTDFQLPIYVMAVVDSLLGGAGDADRCGYYSLRPPTEQMGSAEMRLSGKGVSLDEVMDAAERWLPFLVGQIRAGQFPVAPRDENTCTWCNFRDICRVNKDRAMRKGVEASQPPQ